MRLYTSASPNWELNGLEDSWGATGLWSMVASGRSLSLMPVVVGDNNCGSRVGALTQGE